MARRAASHHVATPFMSCLVQSLAPKSQDASQTSTPLPSPTPPPTWQSASTTPPLARCCWTAWTSGACRCPAGCACVCPHPCTHPCHPWCKQRRLALNWLPRWTELLLCTRAPGPASPLLLPVLLSLPSLSQSAQLRFLRAQLGLVSQEPTLFATTIAENIRWVASGHAAGWSHVLTYNKGSAVRGQCTAATCHSTSTCLHPTAAGTASRGPAWRRWRRRPGPPTPTTSSPPCPRGEHRVAVGALWAGDACRVRCSHAELSQ